MEMFRQLAFWQRSHCHDKNLFYVNLAAGKYMLLVLTSLQHRNDFSITSQWVVKNYRSPGLNRSYFCHWGRSFRSLGSSYLIACPGSLFEKVLHFTLTYAFLMLHFDFINVNLPQYQYKFLWSAGYDWSQWMRKRWIDSQWRRCFW